MLTDDRFFIIDSLLGSWAQDNFLGCVGCTVEHSLELIFCDPKFLGYAYFLWVIVLCKQKLT